MNAREERLVTENNLWELDAWLDDVDVYAKPHFDYVNSQLVNTGIKFGNNPTRMTAFIGDTIVRHEDGSHTVLSAKDAAELARLQAERHTTNTALSEAAEALRVQRDRIAELEAAAGSVDSDFYQPGHTYTDTNPKYDWQFRCDVVTTHPEDGERTALGWRFFNGTWFECAYGEDDWDVQQFVPTKVARKTVPQQRQTEDPAAPGPCGDPIAYGPTGVRCGCGKDAHSNLTPCRPNSPEDPHDSPLHHNYADSRDLPTFPQQQDRRAL